MKSISLVTHCYNEEANVQALCEAVKRVMLSYDTKYTYEHIFIDNASTDSTVDKLKEIADADNHVKIIVNTRNFGQIRSATHAILEATGDAVISLVADLQDPPELIPDFISKWEEGFKIVIGVRTQSEETPLFSLLRTFYYILIARLSDVPLAKHFTGFGLYDRRVIEAMRQIQDPYPYFRGLICDIGFERCEIPYVQPTRKRGITKNNLYTLYDMAMLGITNHSKVPLRLAAMIGFAMAIISATVALIYFIYKLLFWNSFPVGFAPLEIGIFFFSSVQLFFLGILGEYIGAIHTQVQKRPLVFEKERINFD